MSKLAVGSCDEYLNFLEQIKNDSSFSKFKCVLGVGDEGQLLAKAVTKDLGLKQIDQEELLFYEVDDVLVVTDKLGKIAKRYVDYEYLVKVIR